MRDYFNSPSNGPGFKRDGSEQFTAFFLHLKCIFWIVFVIVTKEMENAVDEKLNEAVFRINAGQLSFFFSCFGGYDNIAEELG